MTGHLILRNSVLVFIRGGECCQLFKHLETMPLCGTMYYLHMDDVCPWQMVADLDDHIIIARLEGKGTTDQDIEMTTSFE